jgi:CheY-like chemotaxis protein
MLTSKLPSKKILVVVDDLMFGVKIDAAARQTALQIEYAKTADAALAAAQQKPALVILDLNHAKLDPIALIETLKKDEESYKVPILGFISHVDAERKQQATDAGCDTVVARSAFSVNLPQILKRHAGAL